MHLEMSPGIGTEVAFRYILEGFQICISHFIMTIHLTDELFPLLSPRSEMLLNFFPEGGSNQRVTCQPANWFIEQLWRSE